MSKKIFCKDCIHLVNRTPGIGFNDPMGDFRCAKSPLLPVDESFINDPVSGALPYQLAALMRLDPTLCGMDAKWFEEEVIPWPPVLNPELLELRKAQRITKADLELDLIEEDLERDNILIARLNGTYQAKDTEHPECADQGESRFALENRLAMHREAARKIKNALDGQ